MALTPSDVASLTSALSYWEAAEYCFGALVAVACLGEYAADFTDWFTYDLEERKRRLAKRSTLLLIASLALELICLVRTNQISSQVVGSLAAKADEAYRKSETAVSNADSGIGKARAASDEADAAKIESGRALTQAKEAGSHLAESLRRADEAEAKSTNAVSSASTALDLARGARKEADAFETRLASAEHKADEAEKHLADTLDRATKAEQESARLIAKFADRTLSDLQVQNIGDALNQFAGQEYEVITYWENPECIAISARIYRALRVAHWTFIPLGGRQWLPPGTIGVLVFIHPSPPSTQTKAAADALILALNAEGITADLRTQLPGNNPPHNRITLSIGAKH